MTEASSEPYVRPDVRALLAMMAAANQPPLHEAGAAAARKAMAQGRDLLDLPVGEIAVERDLAIPGPAGSIPARLFDARESRGAGPVLVYFHGGGFVLGDLDSHAPVTAEMARALDLPVVAIDYRLAPEHPWPAATDDCEAAARWIASSPPELGRAATGVVLSGDSAGGTLTVVTAMALREAPAAVPVFAQFPIYPSMGRADGTESYKLFSEGYLLTRDAMRWFTESFAAPRGHWRGEPGIGPFDGLPPAVILTAGLDPLRDEGRGYAQQLIAAGVPTVFREAAGNIHGFVNARRAIPSSVADFAGALAALSAVIAESEAVHAARAAA